MTYQEKITKAKAKLMLEYPYFGTIASSIKLEKNNEIVTFLSDGDVMYYNSEYLERLSLSDVEFMMANGAMHIVLQHQNRLSMRTKWLWQTATDYVVNSMLVKNGMQLPQYANYEEKFDGLYAEEIYEMLRAEMIDNVQYSMEQEQQYINNSNDEHAENLYMQEELSRSLDAKESKYDANDENKEDSFISTTKELSQELKEHFEHIFQKLKREGNLPKDIEFVLPEYFSHKVDWRELLYGHIASYAKSSYAFIPPNMKYLYRGIYLPSLSSDFLKIVVAIDTSGSIDEVLLATFLAEVNSIMQQYQNYEINLITADAKVHSHKVYLPGEKLDYKLSGGGGTDFRPVFKFIDDVLNYPTLLLYFTDGQGNFPSYEPSYDVVWIMPKIVDVPFGEVIVLES